MNSLFNLPSIGLPRFLNSNSNFKNDINSHSNDSNNNINNNDNNKSNNNNNNSYSMNLSNLLLSSPLPLAPRGSAPHRRDMVENELNLNLRQEKEEINKSGKNKKGTYSAYSTVQSPGIERNMDFEEISDCRVYRFEWTDGMFDIAFQGLKNVPRNALEDYLMKYF